MTSLRAFWETLIQRFDPQQPVQEHGEWRAERPNSPRDQIIRGLGVPSARGKRYLMVGTVGTGKTTELLAIAESQHTERLVVFFDVERHFSDQLGDPHALNHVQPWEVLLLIGVAVYKSAKGAFGHDWAKEHLSPFQRAVQAFTAPDDDGARATLDLGKLASSLTVLAAGAIGGAVAGGAVAGGLRVVGAAAKATRWEFPLGGRERQRLADQNQKVRDLLDATNLLIGTIQQSYRPLVLVIDGLDRIRDTETTRYLFTESNLLGSLVCATVITGPLVLRRQGLASVVRHFEPKVLANVPVLDHQKPGEKGSGIEFMVEVYNRRLKDIPRPDVDAGMDAGIPEPLLRELAYYSGGRPRDFVRFIRMVAERAWTEEVSAADEALIKDCIDERRRVLEMGMNRAEIELLEAVAHDPEHVLPDDTRVESLLDRHCLLPYPNESEWYYPNPLLTLHRVKTG